VTNSDDSLLADAARALNVALAHANGRLHNTDVPLPAASIRDELDGCLTVLERLIRRTEPTADDATIARALSTHAAANAAIAPRRDG